MAGGLVGYMGYDCVHNFEPLGKIKPDAIGMPEMVFMIPETIICFDHLHAEVLLTRCLPPGSAQGKNPNALYDQIIDELEKTAGQVMAPADFKPPQVRDSLAAPAAQPDGLTSNFEADQYREVVRRAKRHIEAGDIFQIVPSQRFSAPLNVEPLEVYRSLRKINPSQYMFVLKLDDCTALGSSPEMQLQVADGKMQLRPIAGTRPRGTSSEDDQQLVTELLADEKELAEHRMLVDLARNDLGRVAQTGSVQIDWLMRAELYSHVIHITSAVSGQLDEQRFSVFDALRSTFPAGTLSGAPKVRAMQLINEFEPVRRNLYGGLVGYVDWRGNTDTCIAIRTMIAKDNVAYVQAGGGLVADSPPEAELPESRNKAQALLRALAEAQRKNKKK
ncbi:MAG: chorismate-binding protein [Betaproteobacteria bacterium]|nr:chorismate-binding protein [Betaproteobacteria bacterium]